MTAPREENDTEISPALSAMIDEVRAEKPEVDWAKLEARLFDDEGEVRAAPKPAVAPKRRVAMLGVFAVAAAFALAIFSPTKMVEETVPSQVAKAVRPPLLSAGAPVAVGTIIDGGHEGAWLRSIGRVSIRFEPGSRGVLLDDGERIRIALETGAIAADVTPVPGGEPFAVDVMGKRVAVHGTHLRVAKLDGSVEVAVSEGNAVIGEPAGEGRTEGPLVLAGSIGTFSALADPAKIMADPSRATSLVEDALAMRKHVEPTIAAKQPEIPTLPPTVVTPPPHAKSEPPVTVPTIAPSVIAPPPPNGLSSDELAAPLALVDAGVKQCLPLQLPSGVSFTADLTLEISPDGKIVDPQQLNDIPVERRECVRTALSKVVFPAAATRTVVERKIVLTGK